MAWSYTKPSGNSGYGDGEVLIEWQNTWTITEAPGASVGNIRLTVSCSTSYFAVRWTSYGGGYDCYATDSITCGGTTLYFRSRAYLNNGGYNFTASVDVPNSWSGQEVSLFISWTNVKLTLGASPSYTLSTSAGTGCSISVNRSTSNVGATGIIANGAIIYSGDALVISFVPSTDYGIVAHTVNGVAFTSGGTHTVSGNVSIAATAQPLASEVAATDANIGAVSTIKVTKHSTGYYHSLQYSFGNLSGYITRTGAVSATESKMNDTSVSFTVPADFYAQIPSSKTGTCTITCRTYSSATSTSVLGTAKTCTFTVTASSASSSPTVSGTVVDINETTKALTGDENVLIKYNLNP